jgi:hypothetical protein
MKRDGSWRLGGKQRDREGCSISPTTPIPGFGEWLHAGHMSSTYEHVCDPNERSSLIHSWFPICKFGIMIFLACWVVVRIK